MLPWSWLTASFATLLADGAAADCTPDPCAEVVAFLGVEPANDAPVPTDGVLVLQANWFGELEQLELPGGLTLTVRRDADEVPGALAGTDIPGVLVWRPDAPLEPGATYEASGRRANPRGVPDVCAPAEVEVEFSFTAGPGPTEPLVKPELRAWTEYVAEPIYALDSLACCDGAAPREREVCGQGHGLVWSTGECAATRERARLRLDLRVSNPVDESHSGQWARRLFMDGEPLRDGLATRYTRDLTAPACFIVEQRSLATGEVALSEERCVGEDFKEPLGDLPRDPWPTLADACADDELYTCEVADGAWDEAACTRWAGEPPPREPAYAGGCDCASGETGGWTLLLGLLGLRTRRCARGRRATHG